MRHWVRVLFVVFLALAGWSAVAPDAGIAQAQTLGERIVSQQLVSEDYDDWERVARRAEGSIVDARASNDAFGVLRRDLVDWRTMFQNELTLHRSKVATLEAQMTALGEAPPDGETEAGDLAARRAELVEEYQIAIAPVRKAEEAYTLADALIRDLDHLLRQRQKQKLLERGPSPLNPASIANALEDLRSITRILVTETVSSFALSSDRALFRQRLWANVGLLLVGGVFLWVGRYWTRRLSDRLVRGSSVLNRRYFVAMLLSPMQVILPGIGLVLLTAALLLSSMFGVKGEAMISIIPSIGLAFFAMRWLAGQTFPKDKNWPSTLDLPGPERRRGRFYMWAVGILVGVAVLVRSLNLQFELGEGSLQTLAFPLICLTGLSLAGLGRLLIANARQTTASEPAISGMDTADERTVFDRVLLVLGRILLVVAVLGPLVALAGFIRAGVAFSLAPALSLGLLAFIAYLQRLNTTAFQVFSGRGLEAREGLWPVVVNSIILLASLPVFAVIWGVRVDQLQVLWLTFQDWVLVGGTRISPMVLLAFAAVFMIGYFMTRLFQGVMRASILPRTSLEPGAQSAITAGLGYVGLTIAAMVAVSVAGLDLSNLAIVAGALSVGLGFGLQNVVSNFVSGLILLAERPVSEGDWIEVAGVMGTVRKISVRATTVETFDRTDVIVPNSDLITSQVTNWTRGNLSGRLILSIGVAYGTDTRRVHSILQEIAEEHPLVIVNPPPLIVFQGFGESSLDFEMRVILRDINFGLDARTELNHRIAERFAEESIEIPFAQRDLWLRNPEALRPTQALSPQGADATPGEMAPGVVPNTP